MPKTNKQNVKGNRLKETTVVREIAIKTEKIIVVFLYSNPSVVPRCPSSRPFWNGTCTLPRAHNWLEFAVGL